MLSIRSEIDMPFSKIAATTLMTFISVPCQTFFQNNDTEWKRDKEYLQMLLMLILAKELTLLNTISNSFSYSNNGKALHAETTVRESSEK